MKTRILADFQICISVPLISKNTKFFTKMLIQKQPFIAVSYNKCCKVGETLENLPVEEFIVRKASRRRHATSRDLRKVMTDSLLKF